MDIETLARKLEPLMPDKVKRWMLARDVADADLRTLIDKQILWTAQKTFGDYRRKLLLSLPPKFLIRGEINLGTILYNGERWSAGLSRRELMQHLAIFGRSGAGKTNVVFHLIKQLADKKIPFLFLDWKRTARHLLPHLKKTVQVFTPGRNLSPLPFNPFIAPPGLDPKVYIHQLVDVLADAYTLGDGARSILIQAILKAHEESNGTPSIKQIIDAVQAIPDKERVRGWKTTALRALESLNLALPSSTTPATQNEIAHQLIKQNTIIELDALASNAKKFLVPLLCQWLYSVELSEPQREQLKLVIIIEEAHHVLYRNEQRAKESLMNMLLRQCREIGIGIIVVDQHPHLISSAALGNTFTSICLNLKDPADINRAAGLSQIPDAEKHYFTELPVGQGIFKMQDRWRKPFLIRFPHIAVDKGAITDDALRKYLMLSKARIKNRPEFRIQSSTLSSTLNENELRFIEDILKHPDDGVKARYQRLKFSVDKGNRIKEELLADSWIESEKIDIGNTRKIVLRLTREARENLGLQTHSRDIDRNSLTHEYWKRRYAAKFREKGFQVALESPRRGGNVDVLAWNDKERIGIEIETGKSNVVSNVRNGLLSGFSNFLVVATDKSAMRKIEEQLAKAGLLIRERARVELAAAG